MTPSICFISTYLNHHNKPICDALYELTGESFHYIATSNIGELRKNMGFSQLAAEYLLDYTELDNRNEIKKIINEADVVITGASEPICLIRERLKLGKLTFRSSERLFKTRSRYLKAPIHWFRCLRTRKAYLLCNGAQTAKDYNMLGFYKRRCYKWGYFTSIKPFAPEIIWDKKNNYRENTNSISVLWVGRLIDWKHPETAILALRRIREFGYRFDFCIIGDGPMKTQIQDLISKYDLNGCVHLLGTKTTEEVRCYMENSEIFLLTSDRQEGWGAVLNESMGCACAVVANSEAGAVPFLINNGLNGLVFENGDVSSLTDCLVKLMESYEYRFRLGLEAYHTISTCWSPNNAAKSLLVLIESLQNKNTSPIQKGPCSLSE